MRGLVERLRRKYCFLRPSLHSCLPSYLLAIVFSYAFSLALLVDMVLASLSRGKRRLSLCFFLPAFRVRWRGARYVTRSGTDDVFRFYPYVERAVCDTILKLFPDPCGVFIDIGAHIGKYSCLAGVRWNRVNIVSIDANKDIIETLYTNLTVNGLSERAVVVFGAASDRNGVAEFRSYSVHTGGSNMGTNGRRGVCFIGDRVGVVTVPTFTLDTVISFLGVKPKEVFLMKVDVEGAEPLVFKGAERLLREGSPVIIFEALTKDKLRECEEVLKGFGYVVEAIDETNYLARKSLKHSF